MNAGAVQEEVGVPGSRDPARARQQLARRLRDLRLQQWPDVRVTQEHLGQALGVGAPMISTWESMSSPKVPSLDRLNAYASFFASRRSVRGAPRVLGDDELTAEERAVRDRLSRELSALRAATAGDLEWAGSPESLWHFPDGEQIRLIGGLLPQETREKIDVLKPSHRNHMRLLGFADLDALVELYGHIRALNPSSDVRIRKSEELRSDDLVGHVVLVGGVALNEATRHFWDQIDAVDQIEDPAFPYGEIFVRRDDPEQRYMPTEDERGVVEDVGLLCRTPNPNNLACTLTICSGVYTRGVLGAVRCLVDTRLREGNEKYLATRFAGLARFGLLMRVRVLGGTVPPPDLSDASSRLLEWPEEAE